MFDSIVCTKTLPKTKHSLRYYTAYSHNIQHLQYTSMGILREPKVCNAENDLRVHCAVHVSSHLLISERDAGFLLNLEVTTGRIYI